MLAQINKPLQQITTADTPKGTSKNYYLKQDGVRNDSQEKRPCGTHAENQQARSGLNGKGAKEVTTTGNQNCAWSKLDRRMQT